MIFNKIRKIITNVFKPLRIFVLADRIFKIVNTLGESIKGENINVIHYSFNCYKININLINKGIRCLTIEFKDCDKTDEYKIEYSDDYQYHFDVVCNATNIKKLETNCAATDIINILEIVYSHLAVYEKVILNKIDEEWLHKNFVKQQRNDLCNMV